MKIKLHYLLGACFLASGASLVVYIFAGVSLGLALIVSAIIISVVGAITWKKSSQTKRQFLITHIKAGLIAGLIGTLAYDLSRFLLIKITGIHFWPFDIFNIFGQSILGQSAQGPWVTVLGVLFHFTNGITFAVSYSILLGKKGVIFGILWALGLETLMVAAYPRWLNITFMSEFLSVSIFGHFIYGATIGYVAKKLIVRYSGIRGEKNGKTLG